MKEKRSEGGREDVIIVGPGEEKRVRAHVSVETWLRFNFHHPKQEKLHENPRNSLRMQLHLHTIRPIKTKNYMNNKNIIH